MVEIFGSGKNPHHKPFNAQYLTKIGLEINGNVPDEINYLFNLYLKYKDTILAKVENNNKDKNKDKNKGKDK